MIVPNRVAVGLRRVELDSGAGNAMCSTLRGAATAARRRPRPATGALQPSPPVQAHGTGIRVVWMSTMCHQSCQKQRPPVADDQGCAMSLTMRCISDL